MILEPKFNNVSRSTISQKELLAKNKGNYEKSGQSDSGERKNEWETERGKNRVEGWREERRISEKQKPNLKI